MSTSACDCWQLLKTNGLSISIESRVPENMVGPLRLGSIAANLLIKEQRRAVMLPGRCETKCEGWKTKEDPS